MARSRRLVSAAFYAATFANFCAFGIYFTALQLFVGDELGGSRAAVGLAIGGFSISAVLVRPAVGRAIDTRGRRRFLLAALAVLMLSSLAFFLVDSVAAAVALRLVQGVAGATFYTTAAAVVTDMAPPARRASAISTFSLYLYGGFALGPALGEQLVRRGGFGAAWGTAAALGAVGLVLATVVPETGEATVAGRRAPTRGRGLRRVLHPAAVGPGIVLMTAGVGYAAVTGFSKLYGREIGLESAGALYAVFAVTVIGVRLLAGRLADRYGRLAVALPGLGLAAVGLATLALIQEPVAAFPAVGAFGAGFALVFPALMALTVDRVHDHERGEALGSFTAFMDLGSGLGGYATGLVADAAGFGAAFGLPAALCVAGALLLAWLGHRTPGPVSEPHRLPA